MTERRETLTTPATAQRQAAEPPRHDTKLTRLRGKLNFACTLLTDNHFFSRTICLGLGLGLL